MDRIELVRKLMKSGKEEDKAILSLLVDTFKFEQVTYKMSEFNEVLKELREYKEMSQEEFSKEIDIDRSVLSRYERGERKIPLDVIDKVLEKFDMQIVIMPRNEWQKEIAEMQTEESKIALKEIFEWAEKNIK